MEDRIKKEFFILIVEDNADTLEYIHKTLENENKNFNILEASNEEEANSALSSFNINLAIIDYYLGDGTADDLINGLIDKNTPVVVISASGEIKKELLDRGINFFLEKPFHSWELKSIVYNLLHLFKTRKELESANTVIEALSKAVEVRDPYTQGHAESVAKLSLEIYHELDFNFIEEENALYIGCLLHDIGKIGIPDDILKSGRGLTKEEYKIIKTHPEKGREICKDLKGISDSLEIILHHHEKLDGSGYPLGLKENKISKIAQIAAVADIYDALTSDRSYRKSLSKWEAFRIMDGEVKKGKINSEYVKILKRIKGVDNGI